MIFFHSPIQTSPVCVSKSSNYLPCSAQTSAFHLSKSNICFFQLSNQSLFINKKFEYMGNFNLNATKFSLFLKVVISAWALYTAIMSDNLNTGLLYLVVAIVFAGLFLFQLKYYQKKKAERGNDRN